jgi:hypothetical protein
MNIRQLAQQLIKEHKKARSWQIVADAHSLTKGEAFAIAVKKHDPADPKIRARLGLGPRPCPTCHRRRTVPRPEARRRPSLFDYPRDELLDMLNNRQVMI